MSSRWSGSSPDSSRDSSSSCSTSRPRRSDWASMTCSVSRVGLLHAVEQVLQVRAERRDRRLELVRDVRDAGRDADCSRSLELGAHPVEGGRELADLVARARVRRAGCSRRSPSACAAAAMSRSGWVMPRASQRATTSAIPAASAPASRNCHQKSARNRNVAPMRAAQPSARGRLAPRRRARRPGPSHRPEPPRTRARRYAPTCDHAVGEDAAAASRRSSATVTGAPSSDVRTTDTALGGRRQRARRGASRDAEEREPLRVLRRLRAARTRGSGR